MKILCFKWYYTYNDGINKPKKYIQYADLSGADLLYCKMDKKVFKQITEEWFEWNVVDKESD